MNDSMKVHTSQDVLDDHFAEVEGLEQKIAALTARLDAQCKLREERERENDALTARVAELEHYLPTRVQYMEVQRLTARVADLSAFGRP